LISELDSARHGWLSSVTDSSPSSSNAGVSAVNRGFSESINIGSLGEDNPASFIFETLNGASAEAAVIAWQVESSLGFAISQGYIREDQGQGFMTVLAEVLSPVSNPRWILALQIVLADFQRGSAIDDGAMATVLSHYLMNERAPSREVVQVKERLMKVWILFLRGFTFLGTARAFGDMQAVEQIRETLGF
jgi:hypothetical protein